MELDVFNPEEVFSSTEVEKYIITNLESLINSTHHSITFIRINQFHSIRSIKIPVGSINNLMNVFRQLDPDIEQEKLRVFDSDHPGTEKKLKEFHGGNLPKARIKWGVKLDTSCGVTLSIYGELYTDGFDAYVYEGSTQLIKSLDEVF